jgi:hypothetical protein
VTDAIDLEEEEPPLTNGIPEHIKNYYGSIGDEDRLFGKLNGRCNVLTVLRRFYIQSTRTGLMLHFRRPHALENWKSTHDHSH